VRERGPLDRKLGGRDGVGGGEMRIWIEVSRGESSRDLRIFVLVKKSKYGPETGSFKKKKQCLMEKKIYEMCGLGLG